MYRYVAVDLETANESRDSACALGWAVVEDGVVVESGWMPIDPELPASAWSDFNTAIHGLRVDDVQGRQASRQLGQCWQGMARCR